MVPKSYAPKVPFNSYDFNAQEIDIYIYIYIYIYTYVLIYTLGVE